MSPGSQPTPRQARGETRRARCGGGDGGDSGPPTGKPAIRRSKVGIWRAVVLGAVQLLMVLHVLQWAATGRTLSPVEPSEAVETLFSGTVNAGAIFFAVALLGTLVLGRWFCGWACHVVLLQDLCGWIMKKLGVRPRAFRSRYLMWVPLILFLYMFVWPVAKRWLLLAGHELGWFDEVMAPWQPSVHMMTEDYWRTFPPWWLAIPILILAGFGVVYFLGAKAYCTYACPYAGCFAALDKLSPVRIRVTDACEQCGHCTAVCTSNVFVAREVHEHGMVVDTGCMKCLDCVSVCPNDALYFGAGRPAVWKGAPRAEPRPRRYDLTQREELAFFVLFWLTFISFLGLYRIVPYLMASGVAALLTWMFWKGWRMLRESDTHVYRYRLRKDGRFTPAGAGFGLVVVLAGLLTLHSGTVRALEVALDRYSADIQFDTSQAFFGRGPLLDEADERDAAISLACCRFLTGIHHGGMALVHSPSVDRVRAWLHTARREFQQAEPVLRRLVDTPGSAPLHAKMLGLVLQAKGDGDEALVLYREVLEREPGWFGVADDAVALLESVDRRAEAIAVRRRLLEQHPDSERAQRELGRTLVDAGQIAEGVALLQQGLASNPADSRCQYVLGVALLERGELDAAHAALSEAARLDTVQPLISRGMARVLRAMGRPVEAEAWVERARQQRGWRRP